MIRANRFARIALRIARATKTPRTSGGHSRGCPGPKNFGQGARNPGKKSKHLGADTHDPEARTSTTLRDPEGPMIKNIQSHSKFSIAIEIFSLDRFFYILARIFQSRRLQFPTKIGPRWVACSEISLSLEIFNLARNLNLFCSLGPLGISKKFGQKNFGLNFRSLKPRKIQRRGSVGAQGQSETPK